MKLRVHIHCADCGGEAEAWVLGGWDIANVQHQCSGAPSERRSGGAEMKEGEFALEFAPPRRAF